MGLTALIFFTGIKPVEAVENAISQVAGQDQPAYPLESIQVQTVDLTGQVMPAAEPESPFTIEEIALTEDDPLRYMAKFLVNGRFEVTWAATVSEAFHILIHDRETGDDSELTMGESSMVFGSPNGDVSIVVHRVGEYDYQIDLGIGTLLASSISTPAFHRPAMAADSAFAEAIDFAVQLLPEAQAVQSDNAVPSRVIIPLEVNVVLPTEQFNALKALVGQTPPQPGSINKLAVKKQIIEQIKLFAAINKSLERLKGDLQSYTVTYQEATEGSFSALSTILKTDLSHKVEERDGKREDGKGDATQAREKILDMTEAALKQDLHPVLRDRMQRLVDRIEIQKQQLNVNVQRRAESFTREVKRRMAQSAKGKVSVLEGDQNHVLISLPGKK